MNANLITSLLLAGAMLAQSNAAFAQTSSSSGTPTAAITTLPSNNYGYAGWGGHASTAAEGYLNGVANVYQGAGTYNYLTSLGNINNQHALKLSYENRKLAVTTYFDNRQINRDRVAIEAGPKPTMDSITTIARESAPRRLTVYDVQPTTGAIRWPAALMDEAYAQDRAKLEQLFAGRSMQNTLSSSDVTRLTRQMKTALASHLNDFENKAEYLSAKNFLDSLNYETRFSPVGGIASR